MQDVQASLPIGSILQDRYTVEELLGKGGFGAVYRVRDLRVKGNLFALKEVVDTNKKERERFRFECEVLKRLDHPALPRVYRTFEDDKSNRAYMLMDYIDGSNLEVLRQHQPQKQFSFAQVIGIMAPIVDAVSYLHQQHPPIIHRDIKPANIIVPEDGGGAVLVDLGIAKEYDQDSTTTAVRHCSPGYGAPEQYASGTNPSTDIYGLGATFHVLLTGKVPADALYRMTQLGSKNIDPLVPAHQLVADIPRYLSDIILQAMAINSKERFASVEEFWQVLNAQHGEPAPIPVAMTSSAISATTPPSTTTPTVVIRSQSEEPRRKKKAALVLLFVALALFALSAGIIFGHGIVPTIHPVNHPATTPTMRSAPAATITSTSATTPFATTPSTPTLGVTPTVPRATPTHPKTTPTVQATDTPTAQPTASPTPDANQ